VNLLFKGQSNYHTTHTKHSMSAANKPKRKNRSGKTQLIDLTDVPREREAMKDFLRERLIFDAATSGTVPNSKPPIAFHRINIGFKNPDASEGDLVLGMDRSFSFGVSENRNEQTQVIQGYSYPISMRDRDGATDYQEQSVQFIEMLAEVCQEHCLQPAVLASMKMQGSIKAHHLEGMNPLYYQKDEAGARIEGGSVTFYPKLMWFPAGEKNGKAREERMFTHFYAEDEIDAEGEALELDPLNFIGKKHHTTPAVKFESLFIGAKTKNIQCKVFETNVKETETRPKRLMKSRNSRLPNVVSAAQDPMKAKGKLDEVKEEKSGKDEKEVKDENGGDDVGDDSGNPGNENKEEGEPKLVASDDESVDVSKKAKGKKGKKKGDGDAADDGEKKPGIRRNKLPPAAQK
jgi:hypothetical protein